MTHLLGQTIGNCQIEALLGSGGMGHVFRARHIHLDRRHALKVLLDQLANDGSFRARFLREARAMAALDHPQIVKIYECGEDQGHLFISMELLSDGSLRGLLDRRVKERQVWPHAFGLNLVRQAAEALAFAHNLGVVHRDIKPDNLLLIRKRRPDGTSTFDLKIGDFGLAQMADAGTLTSTGMTVGTPAYMSPEQCLGNDLDGRTDIYSLGVVLYELLTGYLPFTAKTTTDVVRKHVQEPPRPPREVDPSMPPAVEAVLLRCLAKRPDERYAGARELAAALAELLAPRPTPAPETPLPIATPPTSFTVRVRDAGGKLLRSLALPEAGLSVGRIAGNDLVLDEPSVSRSHLRIGRGRTRARVTDLRSSGGTTLDGAALTPYVEQPWAIGQQVRVGPYTLELEAAAPPRLVVTLPGASDGLTLIPGKPALVTVVVANKGERSETAALMIEGVPPEWVRLPGQALSLAPGATTTVALTVVAPTGPAAPAGTYTVVARVQPASDPSAAGEVQTRWQVAPAPAARLALTPTELTAAQEGSFTLTLANEGNLPARFRLGAHDPAGGLSFRFAQEIVELEPGAMQTIILTAQAQRRILGRKRSYEFTVRAETQELACEASATFTQDGPLLF